MRMKMQITNGQIDWLACETLYAAYVYTLIYVDHQALGELIVLPTGEQRVQHARGGHWPQHGRITSLSGEMYERALRNERRSVESEIVQIMEQAGYAPEQDGFWIQEVAA
jgi:hypothetical protein